MTVVVAVAVALLAGLPAVALGRSSRVAAASTLGGLIVVVALALAIRPEDRDILLVGGEAIVESAYLRLYLILGGLAALLLALLGIVVGSPTTAGGVALLALAGGGLALATADVIVAILASVAGSVAAAVVIADRRSGPRITVAARALRAIVVAGMLALAAALWLSAGSLGQLVPGVVPVGAVGTLEPGMIGAAYLAAAAAVAIRTGAIPFHGWAARIAEATPPVGLPAGLILGPAAFTVVVVAWLDGSVGTVGEPLLVERAIVVVIAAASLLLGAVAAWLHDDVEHVIAYSLVQDAGVVLLAIAALDPAAWEPVRIWVLAVVVVKSGLAGWAAAVRHTFGTRRVPELGGWARRSPVLGVAFAIILVATVGLPGLAAFEARATLIALVVDGPFALVLFLGALAPIAYLGRILLIGLDKPSPSVLAAPSPMPTWSGLSAWRRDGMPARIATLPAAIADTIDSSLRANRAPIAAGLVFVLSSLAIAVSAGGLGTVQAAAEPAIDGGLTESFRPDGPGEPSVGPDEVDGGDGSGSPALGSPAAGSPAARSPASDSPAVDGPTEPAGAGTPGGAAATAATDSAPPAVEAPSANPGPSFAPVTTP